MPYVEQLPGQAEAEAQAKAEARVTAQELAWREAELARWEIILTAAVGAAALFAAGFYAWQAHRHHRKVSS